MGPSAWVLRSLVLLLTCSFYPLREATRAYRPTSASVCFGYFDGLLFKLPGHVESFTKRCT